MYVLRKENARELLSAQSYPGFMVCYLIQVMFTLLDSENNTLMSSILVFYHIS